MTLWKKAIGLNVLQHPLISLSLLSGKRVSKENVTEVSTDA